MLRAGVTGGIGSGKTTVCRVFEALGVPVFYADAEAKKLYSENRDLQIALLAAYGPEVLINGNINKPFLAGIAFGSAEASQKLNDIVHPFVFDHYEAWCKAHEQHPYTIKEAAIMFESGSYKRLHRIIGVVASDDIRIQRVMERDQYSEEEVLKRIQKQMPPIEMAARCHYIVENDGSKSVVEQVLNIHQRLLEDAQKNLSFIT